MRRSARHLRSVLIRTFEKKARAPASRHFSSGDGDPLGTINAATDSIRSFSSRLSDLSATIQKNISLSSGQNVTLRDIVLHSRDASSQDFASPAAVAARSEIRPVAEQVEAEMTSMSKDFLSTIAPQMAKAAGVCQNTPCGGATYELAEAGRFSEGKDVQEEFRGEDTPCGRLETASRDFVEMAHETREEVALGARAACLLRLAEEHGAPLVEVQKTREGKEAMAKRFALEKVSTPWVRSKEEYEQFQKMREEL